MQSLPDALIPLADYRQFVLSKIVPTEGKSKKLPVDPRTLQVFKKEDDWQNTPSLWTDASTAVSLANMCGPEYCIGFFLTPTDPFFFVDIDDCLEADNETWSPVALDLINRLPGAAIEVSQGGRGLHIIGKGITPSHGCRNLPLNLEFYTEKRLMTLTGINAMGSAGVDCTATLPALVNSYFPPTVATNPTTWTTEPVAEWNGPADDDTLIKNALASKSAASAFGARASFADLWNRNIDILSDVYAPDESDAGEFDESQADAALAQHLAFWTGNNCDRMLVLMNQSGLVRQKWTSHKSYLRNTIIRAVSLQTMVYTGSKKKEPERIPVDPTVRPISGSKEPEILTGYQFLGITQQIEHFRGCVYIQEQHKIFTSTGTLLKPEQFNATYGGYVFQMDTDSGGKTTKKAWEAFTESQAVRFPKAKAMCFRPELAPGEFVREEGVTLVNVYVPTPGDRAAGDISPFLAHVKRLLPDANDREIFISYLAAFVQQPGIKFQWCVVLQGVEGNGKTIFFNILAYALGKRYAHLPNAAEITNRFNSWIDQKLVIGIEEVHTQGRQEVADTLKPMITNKRIEIHGKGQDQRTGDNCANFIMFSNHKDAVLKTENDRRYCVFYTAQQNETDLTRDDMSGDYFPNLYGWFQGGGFSHVSHYLDNYPVKVNVMGRAPVSSSTAEAVRSSMGVAEQVVQEAIDLGENGFRSDLASTKVTHDLLIHNGKKLSPQKVAVVLTNLDYIKHPALASSDGKVSIYGKRHRVYTKRGSLAAQLITSEAVADAWVRAQEPASPSHKSVQPLSVFSELPQAP